MTQGVKLGPPGVNLVSGVKPLVNRVRPVGGLTPARPDAAARLGFASPETKRPAEGIYLTLVDSRVEWCRRWVRGWPELSPASTLAVAEARVSSGSTLRWPGRLVRGTYVLYVAREGS